MSGMSTPAKNLKIAVFSDVGCVDSVVDPELSVTVEQPS
jgi:hypothetical protein